VVRPRRFVPAASLDSHSGIAFQHVRTCTWRSCRAEPALRSLRRCAPRKSIGVEWAVLSACDTGLGELRTGEGVLGLRRSFQVAGARTLVMSLGRVKDDASRDWMGRLYNARFSGRSTSDSIREASLAMLRSARKEGRSTHPFYWGAFVGVGDWR